MLVVQIVETLWTKATRGAPRSNERVGLPKAFPVLDEQCEYLVQHHKMAEWEGFKPVLASCECKPSAPGSEGVLRISPQRNGEFELGFLGTPHGGMPKRYPITKAFHLMPGQYARLIVNARHVSTSGQFYSETVYNITCGEHIPPDRFLRSAPDQLLDLKEALF